MTELRPAATDDLEFLYSVHRSAMKPHVEKVWGWEEAWQARRFQERIELSSCQIITHEGVDVGFISLRQREDSFLLGTIEILPDYQRRGIGTRVIGNLLSQAVMKGFPVTLRVLKVNPARALYRRLGFVVTGETITHYLMKADH